MLAYVKNGNMRFASPARAGPVHRGPGRPGTEPGGPRSRVDDASAGARHGLRRCGSHAGAGYLHSAAPDPNRGWMRSVPARGPRVEGGQRRVS